jgi:hypothetical protein
VATPDEFFQLGRARAYDDCLHRLLRLVQSAASTGACQLRRGGARTTDELVAAAALLDVISHLAHDGIDPRWVTLEITGPTNDTRSAVPSTSAKNS